MRCQYRWCVIVWSSGRASQVCWMCPKVWTGRAFSVVNLPCDTHNVLQRSHLSDSLQLVILLRQRLDGKQFIIDWIILLWSWCRICVFLSHSPILSRFSPSVKTSRLWRLMWLGGPVIVPGLQVVFVLLLSGHSHLLVCIPCTTLVRLFPGLWRSLFLPFSV